MNHAAKCLMSNGMLPAREPCLASYLPTSPSLSNYTAVLSLRKSRIARVMPMYVCDMQRNYCHIYFYFSNLLK